MYDILSKLNHKVNGYAELLLPNRTFTEHFKTKNPLCLPNTLSISFPNVPNQSLIAALHEKVCVSAGAACHSDRVELSAVLKAMGVSPEVGMGTLRITVGDGLTEESCVEAA